MKLYVGNLPWDVDNDKLQDLVRPFGEPETANVITDRDTGQSRGFGFVEFSDDAAARAAIDGLHGKELGGRSLVVNEARPSKGGGGRGFGGGGGGRRGESGGGGRGGYGGRRY